jgi:hypothetical protein
MRERRASLICRCAGGNLAGVGAARDEVHRQRCPVSTGRHPAIFGVRDYSARLECLGVGMASQRIDAHGFLGEPTRYRTSRVCGPLCNLGRHI